MIEQLVELGPFQWAGLLFGLLYILFAVQNRPICWLYGIFSCTAIAIEDFVQTRLYSDGVLQLFYIAIAVYGLVQWKSGATGNLPLKISSMTIRQHLVVIVSCAILASIGGYIVRLSFDAAFPYLDSWTTVFSIAASFMLVYRKVDNWIYWIVIDLIYIYLYFARSAPLFGVLYFVFTGMAVFGFINWKRKMSRRL